MRRALGIWLALLTLSGFAAAQEPTGWSDADLGHRCWQYIASFEHGRPLLWKPEGLVEDAECRDWITTRWGDYSSLPAWPQPYPRPKPERG